MSAGYQSYQNTLAENIASSSPERLMVMLYEGAITKLKQGKERHIEGHTIGAKESIMRAMKIVDALMEYLNLEEGGEAAKNLERIYSYAVSELSAAMRTTDPNNNIDNVINTLQPLLEGWRGLEEKVHGKK